MPLCNNLVFNNEILINEAHTNKYIFVLDKIPTSYLLSKFTEADIQNIMLNIGNPTLYQQEIAALQQGVFQEQNQDLHNFLLYVQNIDVPDVSVGYSTNGTRYATIKHMDGKIEFGDLTMNVMCDEQWFIYRMLYYWLLAAHNPEEHMKFTEREYYNKFYVTGTLIILDNQYNIVYQLQFQDLHPSAIGQVNLKEAEADKIIIPVTWVHSGMVPSDRYILKRV